MIADSVEAASRGLFDRVVASALFSGSGWLLTLMGTAFATYTMLQVGRKNSAFRRAVRAMARRSSAERIQSNWGQLKELASTVTALKMSGRSWIEPAMQWSAAAGEALAAHEAYTASRVLDGSAARERAALSSASKKWQSSVEATGRRSFMGAEPADRGLAHLLAESRAAAKDVVMHQDVATTSAFRACVCDVLNEISYLSTRAGLLTGEELHDDR